VEGLKGLDCLLTRRSESGGVKDLDGLCNIAVPKGGKTSFLIPVLLEDGRGRWGRTPGTRPYLLKNRDGVVRPTMNAL